MNLPPALLDAWLDGELDPEGRARLEQALSDPATAREFVRACHQEAALPAACRGRSQRRAEGVGSARQPRQARRAARSRLPLWIGIGAAAALAIALGTTFVPPAAMASAGLAWTATSTPLEIRHHGALMHLAPVDGAPARAASEAGRVRLERGRLELEVAPQDPATPFTVVTAEALLSVMGTRFSVDARPGETSVTVEAGHVRMSPRHGPERILGPGAIAIAFAMPAPTPCMTWQLEAAGGGRVPGTDGAPDLPLASGRTWSDGSLRLDQDDDVAVELSPAASASLARILRRAGGASLEALVQIERSSPGRTLLLELNAPQDPACLLQLWSPEGLAARPERTHLLRTWSDTGRAQLWRDGELVSDESAPWNPPAGPAWIKVLWPASSHPSPRPASTVRFLRLAVYAGTLDAASVRRLAGDR